MNMAAPRCDILGSHRDRLGECPLWDMREQALYWIDAKARRVQRLQGKSYCAWHTPSDVGAIALARPGLLVLALENGFHLLDLVSGTTRLLAEVVHAAPLMRMNDGRTDRQGRFVSGSMVLGRHDSDAAYYRLEHDGRVQRLFGGIALANATCFSPDGRCLYHADSLSNAVSVADYDPVSGAVGERHTLFHTQAYGSAPDGMTVDAEGRLWLALVQAGKVGCFSPDGALQRLIEVPTPYPSCLCFGGPELDVLYVTSISNSGHLLQSSHPNAGALIALHNLGVRGLAEVPFNDTSLA